VRKNDRANKTTTRAGLQNPTKYKVAAKCGKKVVENVAENY
jgi:hypothetical protein